MFSFFQSIATYVFNLFARAAFIQFAVMTAVYWVVTEITNAALSLIEFDKTGSGLQSAVEAIPSDVVYFLVMFRLDVGIPMILAAMLARFLIRRLPVVG